MYHIASLPLHVIIEDDKGQLWMVPVSPNGWGLRRRYHGWRKGLEPFGTGEAIMRATLGIPDPAHP